MKDYKIDYTTSTITVTKDFLRRASEFDTPEQQKMEELRKLGMTIAAKTVKHKASKAWNCKRMEKYISFVENSEEYRADYDTVKAAKGYAGAWKWFRTTFPNYKLVEELKEHKIVVTPAAHDEKTLKAVA